MKKLTANLLILSIILLALSEASISASAYELARPRRTVEGIQERDENLTNQKSTCSGNTHKHKL